MENEKKICLIPGSFDPITRGHLFLVKKALSLFDEVVVAVMVNAEKTTLFSREERLVMVQAALAGEPRTRAVAYDGWQVDLYREIGACAVLKGVRNEADFAYEKTVDDYCRAHLEGFSTLLTYAEGPLAGVSSTAVRRLLADGKTDADALHPYLTESVIEAIRRIPKAERENRGILCRV